MTFTAKLLLSNIIIITCVFIGKKFPSLAGLIAIQKQGDSSGDIKQENRQYGTLERGNDKQ